MAVVVGHGAPRLSRRSLWGNGGRRAWTNAAAAGFRSL